MGSLEFWKKLLFFLLLTLLAAFCEQYVVH